MRILDSTCITGNVSKILETPDGFAVNAQIYDKNSIAPIPLSFLSIPVSVDNEMLLYQTGYVAGPWTKNSGNCGYIIDNTDPNSYYIVVNSLNGNTSGIYKITKNNNGTFTTSVNILGSNPYSTFFDIIGQDSQNVYYSLNRNYGGAYSYIGSFNKTTLATQNVNINTGTFKVLKITDMYIYVATNNTSADTLYIIKYNKVSNAYTIVFSDTTSTGYYYDNIVSDMSTDGVFYCKRDGKGFGMSDHFICYRKYVLNTDKDTVTATTVTLDNGKYPSSQILINAGSNVAMTNYMFGFTDSVTGKKYMSCLVYNKGTGVIVLNPSDSALYTYEMVDADNWKLVSYKNFAPVLYKTALPLFGNQTLILAHEYGAHIYMWNPGLLSYQKVSSYDIPIYAVGCDGNNRIWIQYKDKSIELASKNIPTTVISDFDKDSYDYQKQDILTSVNVAIQNYKGEYISREITLLLFGPCKFTSNGSSQLKVTTTTDGLLSVPVTVYDEGNLEVLYEL